YKGNIGTDVERPHFQIAHHKRMMFNIRWHPKCAMGGDCPDTVGREYPHHALHRIQKLRTRMGVRGNFIATCIMPAPGHNRARYLLQNFWAALLNESHRSSG